MRQDGSRGTGGPPATWAHAVWRMRARSLCLAAGLVLLSPLLLLAYLLASLVALVVPVAFTRWFIFNVPGASWQQGDLPAEKWQPAHRAAPRVALPGIGELVEHDFRDADAGFGGRDAAAEVRVVTWNIFLAQDLQGVMDELLKMDPCPDVVLLQEDNIFADPGEPGTFRHAGGAIAAALRMTCIFTPACHQLSEFVYGKHTVVFRSF